MDEIIAKKLAGFSAEFEDDRKPCICPVVAEPYSLVIGRV